MPVFFGLSYAVFVSSQSINMVDFSFLVKLVCRLSFCSAPRKACNLLRNLSLKDFTLCPTMGLYLP
jgi:hypothetical protein